MATNNAVRIRRSFAPLNTAQSIVCVSGGSPTTQVYNVANSSYEPNRANTPCVLHPDITAYASDGTWKYQQANAVLANMVWLVNGKDISKVWAASEYSINQDGATRGDLTIFRNVAVAERFALRFKAEIVDYRTNVNVPVLTDEVVLNTVSKSDDAYSMALDDDETIIYNPILDRLLLYDYKVAHGMIAASDAVRNSCIDENAYLRKIPLHIYKGAKSITSGYTIKLYKMSGSSMTQISVGMNEVVAISNNYITLDLRLIYSASYVIKAYVGDTEVCNKQISVSRTYPKYSVSAGQNVDISPGVDNRQQIALVNSEGNIVECPANVLKLNWSTIAQNAGATTTRQWQEGDTAIFNISDTGLGDTADDELEIRCDAEYKPSFDLFSDGSEPLVDENGEYLIGN